MSASYQCGRCNSTGVEPWAGRIVGRDVEHAAEGPCLRCCRSIFWKAYNCVGNKAAFTGIVQDLRARAKALREAA